MNTDAAIRELFESIAAERAIMDDPDIAHVVIDQNRVLGMKSVPGLHVDVEEKTEGVAAVIRLDEGVVLKKTVHLCFGVLPERGVQHIEMDVDIGAGAGISVLAYCSFPNAVDVRHIMDGRIRVREGAAYTYFERHFHSPAGGIYVRPKAVVAIERGGRFKTEFELIKGRVGSLDIDYETTCAEKSVMDMTARITGSKDDRIVIHETGRLAAYATGVLTSKVALRDDARAEVYNTITANGPYARGHVDCKEIVRDRAVAIAVPVVEVRDPRAHVTHEAAIGSVDSRQLQTLMSRGLSEDQATDLIIAGLLGESSMGHLAGAVT